jgi:hypothetical protein
LKLLPPQELSILFPAIQIAEKLLAVLDQTPDVRLIDTKAFATELHFVQAENIARVTATNFMPLNEAAWIRAIREHFQSGGDKIIEKNPTALRCVRELTA